jgi:hypothetical protein
MKHVGKMKNNGAPVAIVFRTLPGDPHSCLVVGTQGLGPTNHDALISVIETPEAQGSFELGTILSVRRFPDNTDMLGWLHASGKLKKVATNEVIVTMAPQNTVQLDELNKLIADQRGVKLEDLAIGSIPNSSKTEITEIARITETPAAAEAVTPAPTSNPEILDDSSLAKNLRSQADAMFKEAQRLRREADELDPPVKKTAKKAEETA